MIELHSHIAERCGRDYNFFLNTLGLDIVPYKGRKGVCTFGFTQDGKQELVVRIRPNPAAYHVRGRDLTSGLQVGMGHRWMPFGEWMSRHYDKEMPITENAMDVSIYCAELRKSRLTGCKDPCLSCRFPLYQAKTWH